MKSTHELIKEQYSEIIKRNRYFLHIIISLSIILVITYFVSLIFIGRYRVDLFAWLSGDSRSMLILNIRIPRVSLALLSGVLLAASGAAMQAIFRNPLASPDIIGVSQGAAFGAALGILIISDNYLLIESISFLFGLVSLIVTLSLSRLFRYGDEILRIILAGIAVSALFSAGIGFIKYIADPYNKLPQIIFWLLGSFSATKWIEFKIYAPLIITSLIVLFLMSWRMNILSLGDELAKALGIKPGVNRFIIIVATVLGVSAVTSVAGVIGWIGLVTPHIARSLVGSENRGVVVTSALLGGLLMISADDIARSLIESELPLNIIISVIMVPLFIFLLSRRRILK